MSSPTPPKSSRLLKMGLIGSAFVLLAVGYVLYGTPASVPAPIPKPPESMPSAGPKDSPPQGIPRPASDAESDDSPGYNEMTAKLRELAALGCTNVLHPPVIVKGTVAWTPKFPEEKNGACLVLLGETGDPRKILTGLIQTPTNEKIDAPASGSSFEFVYCANAPGPHPINVTSPTNENYTFAAVDCPLDVSRKRIEENVKK